MKRLLRFATAAIGAVGLGSCHAPSWRNPASASAAAQPPYALAGAAAAQAARLAKFTTSAAAMPAPPAWAAPLIGAELKGRLPGIAQCIGNTDMVVLRYAGAPAGLKILGWAWDPTAGRRVDRILLVDGSGRIVGAGEGGVPRPDVSAAKPDIRDPDTGWYANAPLPATSVDAYGVVAGGVAACHLGHLQI